MHKPLIAVLAIAALASATTGCATRRFVRNRTEPLNQQVSELDKRASENARKIGELDDKTGREISRVGEKAEAADTHANEAARQASEALTKTGQAIEKADGARSVAENSLNRTGQLERYVDNYENFQMATSKTVYFSFDKATLSDEAMKELDDLAQSLANAKKYIIEVQGFTDVTGSSEYNYGLSEKRAGAVVRYLTEKHNIPVYRVHRIGLGKDMPATAENKREARKLSRRVEVKVYNRPELPMASSTTSGTPSLPPQDSQSPEPR